MNPTASITTDAPRNHGRYRESDMPTPAKPAAAAKPIGMQQAIVASALSTALADAATVFVPVTFGVMPPFAIGLRSELTSRSRSELAAIGIVFALQFHKQAFVALLALQRLQKFIVAEQFAIGQAESSSLLEQLDGRRVFSEQRERCRHGVPHVMRMQQRLGLAMQRQMH